MRFERGPHPLVFYLSQLVSRTAEEPDQPARLERFLAALRAYQQHPYRRSLDEPPVVAEAGAARLLSYGGDGPAVVFVPSLINPSWVLDLSARRSLLRWLSGRGVRPFLVDWGEPGPEERGFSLDDYVTRRLLPLVEALDAPVTLVGYCLGGTLAVAAACLSPRVERLAVLAAPWDFAAYDEEDRNRLAAFAAQWEPLGRQLGVFPAEALQIAFWALDPDLLERKFARFSGYDPASEEAEDFVALEDWANSGPPLSLPAARQCFEAFFGRNAPGAGDWSVNGTAIAPGDLQIPALVVSAGTDRIVPRASSAPLADAIPGAEALYVDAGHVGMVTGSRAPSLLWEPLARWLGSR